MKNQSSADGAPSPQPQAMMDPASKDIIGQGPAVDSSTGAGPSLADTLDPSAAPGRMAPDSAKGGHV